jgi:cytochrome c oxidase cbb3-type subunit 3
MRVSQKNRCLLVVVACLWWAGVCENSSSQVQQPAPVQEKPRTTQASGNPIFSSTCAGCHGLDGRGGERAPGIAGNAQAEGLSDAQIFGIISNGISGTGMPAFRSLGEEQVRALVRYVRTLQGKGEARTLPVGDATHGKDLFYGKGECSACHMISGQGGFLGPDLSNYGAQASADTILGAIVNPDRVVPAGYRSGVATTRDGTRVAGVIRNEDNFSLQIMTADGSFHFFEKSDLQKMEYPQEPLMPTNYRARLSASDLNDLVSYLTSTSASPIKKNAVKRTSDDAEEVTE